MLLLHLGKTTEIEIGAIGTRTFKRGFYVYFGTAHGGGGVCKRVGRHARLLGDNKKRKWNVDYFREHATLVEVWFSHAPAEFECRWSKAFSRLSISSVPVKKMGGWDCKTCPAHFYKLSQRPTTSLLREVFSTTPIQVSQYEPRRPPKSELEWEPDYWAGRKILERARLEYYRREVALPDRIANLGGNPVLRELIAGSKSAAKLKQVKLAHAVDSLIAAHGEWAYRTIFDLKKPQTRKAILQISRKSWERQDDRFTDVCAWDAPSIAPQKGDPSPDTSMNVLWQAFPSHLPPTNLTSWNSPG